MQKSFFYHLHHAQIKYEHFYCQFKSKASLRIVNPGRSSSGSALRKNPDPDTILDKKKIQIQPNKFSLFS